MQRETPSDPGNGDGTPGKAADVSSNRNGTARHRRSEHRYPLPIRASVMIPGLPTREYGVCEISRSGMFLAFLDVTQTRPEFEQSGTGPGSRLKVSFEITHPEVVFRCQVPASIVRVTQSGLGVQVDAASHRDMETLIGMLPPVRHRAGGEPG